VHEVWKNWLAQKRLIDSQAVHVQVTYRIGAGPSQRVRAAPRLAERTKKSVAIRPIQDLKAVNAIVSRRVAKTVAKVLRTKHAPTNLHRTLIAQSRAISPVGRAVPVIKPAIKHLSKYEH